MHVNDKIIFLFVKLVGGQSEGRFRFTPSAFVTGVKRRRVEGRVFFVFLTPSPEMHSMYSSTLFQSFSLRDCEVKALRTMFLRFYSEEKSTTTVVLEKEFLIVAFNRNEYCCDHV